MSIDTKRFQSFLDQFRLIKEKHDEVARANGERFNVFSALGVETAEVRHSAFLAELLNPNGAHAQGAVFLRLFFDMLQANFVEQFQWKLSDDEIDGFEVTAEAHRGDFGRIDILIERGDRCMVIENKIYAGDQERQLGRYYDYAKAKECVAVIYLTLDGKAPDKYTLYGEAQTDSNSIKSEDDSIKSEDVLRVSYKDIINWLDECLKATVRLAHIRETLFQYQSLLKQLTGQTLNRRFIMDTNALFSSNENYRLISDLEPAIREFKIHLEHQFWSDVCKELGKIENIDSQLEQAKEATVRYVDSARGREGEYGVTWNVNSEIEFGIFIDHDANGSVFFLFRMRDGEKISPETEEKYKKKLSDFDFGHNQWHGYFCWKYCWYNGKELRISLSGLCENGDAPLRERGEVAKDIVSQAQGIIKRFLGGVDCDAINSV